MAKTKNGGSRRRYDEELKREAVQMLMDGPSAASVAANLRLSGRISSTHGRRPTSKRAAPRQRFSTSAYGRLQSSCGESNAMRPAYVARCLGARYQ